MYRVYLKASAVNSRDERSTPVRDFAVGETKETEDVSSILRGFLCAHMR